MKIGGIKKLDISNYPNKMACVIYVLGCNYKCPWCNSPELVREQDAKTIDKKQVFKYLRSKQKKLDGVVLCGGEPTIYPTLPWFLIGIKKLGLDVKLNTNGSNPQMLKKLIETRLVDYVAMDIKAPKEKYAEMIGFEDCTSNYLLNGIERSIDILKNSKIDYEFVTTMVPLLNKKDILKIAKWLKGAKKYRLQNFESKGLLAPEFTTLDPLPQNQLVNIRQAVAPFFDECELR